MSQPHTFTVVNSGGASTGNLTVALGGADKGDFVLTNMCLGALGGTKTCTASVVFKPTSTADKNATLTVSGTPGGMAVVNLKGSASSLSIDPTDADFMTVNVNSGSGAKAFTVKNNGTAATSALTASVSSAQFQITSNTCNGATLAAGATCTVGVTFNPTSPGLIGGILTVAGGGGEKGLANLKGVGAGTGLSVDMATVNFGSVGIGSHVDKTVTITNTGTNMSGTLTPVIGGANGSQFTVLTNNCASPLVVAGTCTLVVRFSPSTTGDKSATLTVTGNPGESVTANLSGSGLSGAIALSIPGPGFTTPVVGQTSTVTYTVTNSGMIDTGMITFSFGGPNAMEFSVTTTNCTALAPAVQCSVTVQFKPTSGGDKNASLVATGMAGPSGQTTITATSVEALEIAPLSAAFAPQSVGTTSTAKTFKVKARAPLGALATAVTGEFAVAPAFACDTSTVLASDPTTWLDDVIAHNPACTLSVVAKPINPRGAKMGTVSVTGTGGVKVTAALTGTGTGPLSITAPVDFGTLAPGTPGTVSPGKQVITVNNNGNAVATGVVANLTGGDVGEFQITANACTSAGTIAAGSTCTVTISFQPTSNGMKKATLTVTATEATLMEIASVDITGTGGTSATTPTPSFSPSPAAVGNVPMSGTGTVTLTFTNPTGSSGPTGTIGLPSSSSLEFAVSNNTCGTGGGTALNVGQSCTFDVKYTPDPVNGVRTTSSTISIVTANFGTVSVTATGSSIQPISVMPAVGDFGNGVVSDTVNGPTVDFTISNSGAPFAGTIHTVAGGASPHAAFFTRVSGITNDCPATIPTGNCVARFRFVPTAAAPATATLQVDDGANRLATSSLTATGVADAQLAWVNISASQTREFGGVRVTGTGVAQNLTLKNVGGFKTSLMTVSSSNAAVFPVTGTCVGMASLDPGASCTVTANFTPGNMTGSLTATINVVANTKLFTSAAPAAVITLHGTGVPATGAGSEYVDPSSADLGLTAPGTTSTTTASFTFHNTSGTPVTLAATPIVLSDPTYTLDLTGANACAGGASITGADGTCTFVVKFAPGAAVMPGFYPATATVNFAGGSATAGLVARAQRLGVLNVTTRPTGDGAFGEMLVSTTSPTRTWVLTNIGDTATGALSITNTDATNFTTGGTCAAAAPGIAAGGTCTVTILAKPTDVLTFTNTVTVTGASLEPGSSPVAVVAATVTGRTAAILAGALPGGFTGFGNVALGDTATTTVTVSNTPANAQITGALGVSVDNTDYTVTGCTPQRTAGVGPGAGNSCALTVTFKPTKVGADNATLTLSASPGGTVPVALTATAVPNMTISDGGAAAPSITTHFAAGVEKSFTVTLNPIANPVASGALKVTITGTDAGLFVKTADDCSAKSLVAGSVASRTCTVGVKYTGSAGTRTAALTVSGSPAGNAVSAALASP